MAAILARKLGMTQRFRDDGRVDRVTVLEAGPCHVTAVRTAERDGYDAVQLGFGALREKRLTNPELGHLKKAGVPPLRHLAEFRDKARRAALRSALSLHAERGSIALVDAGGFDAPSSRQAAQALAKWDQPAPTLVALAEDEVEAAKSFRNLSRVTVLPAADVGVADLVGAASLVVSLEALTARAKGEAPAGEEAA